MKKKAGSSSHIMLLSLLSYELQAKHVFTSSSFAGRKLLWNWFGYAQIQLYLKERVWYIYPQVEALCSWCWLDNSGNIFLFWNTVWRIFIWNTQCKHIMSLCFRATKLKNFQNKSYAVYAWMELTSMNITNLQIILWVNSRHPFDNFNNGLGMSRSLPVADKYGRINMFLSCFSWNLLQLKFCR